MKVGVPRETRDGERRVAIVPDVAKRLVDAGHEVLVEGGAGVEAFCPDDEFAAAGAKVEPDVGTLLGVADVVCKVQPPAVAEVGQLREGSTVVSFLQPAEHLDVVRALAERGVTSFGFELLPRISRAQPMDALSSQATVAGYLTALLAASRLPRFFPMLITAAGTIPPAKVFVLGAGVAGLQAIATARRLGAVVSAYDVRPAARDEVRSLGATFVELPLESQEGAGGYAREQSEDFLGRQRDLIAERVALADAVLTTAVVPGRPAPLLVTDAMVGGMRAGSVLVDLAAESGGNCELSEPGIESMHHGVRVVGARNLPSAMPLHASALYARNVASLLGLLAPAGELAPDFTDEVVAATCVTREGDVVAKSARSLLTEQLA